MRNLILSIATLLTLHSLAQQPIEVWQGTIKVGGFGNEEMYFGFAEGDQLIFSFQEVNGKELKQIEINEWPGSSKFSDFKVSKVENKQLNIQRQGVYQIKLTNGALGGRICRLHIARVPASDASRNFNTSVQWTSINDTTYTNETERYLAASDTSLINRDFVVKVNSETNANGARQLTDFDLPANTVSWSYYIGVDQEGREAYEQATQKFAQTASPIVAKIPGYGPLAALALNGFSYFTHIQKGEDISYYILDAQNATLATQKQPFKCYRQNKVINDFSSMTSPRSGKHFFYFINDNLMVGVDVTVKITAVVVNERWDERPVQKMNVSQRKVPVILQ
ncbi:MAG: hypothetical protein JNK79_10240 [Chitinophagaceae bacterium]|nr:hypothetical protein [Chitinophagaceae bacterium]